MDRIQRQIVLPVLAISPAFAGAARAMRLAYAKGAMAVEICADGATVSIYLDENGISATAPTDSTPCPECLSVESVDHVPIADLLAAGAFASEPITVSHVSVLRLTERHLRPETRGPRKAAHKDAPTTHFPAPHPNGLCLTKACK